MWSILISAAAVAYALAAPDIGDRWGLLVLLALWALRLTIYITWRNWGEAEDHRYQEIRKRNQPHFAFKSVYLIFILQATLAWVVALPLMAALTSPHKANWLDAIGGIVVLFGLVFETIGDAQLARFKSEAANKGKVMDQGLWRYTRHPNYFGEFCVWWGFYLIGLASGAWWSVISPAFMTLTLFKVSGVALLEKAMTERRPAYRDYIASTNAFFPGPPRGPAKGEQP
jgi:steroid 5-alpha reductase family enzyme